MRVRRPESSPTANTRRDAAKAGPGSARDKSTCARSVTHHRDRRWANHNRSRSQLHPDSGSAAHALYCVTSGLLQMEVAARSAACWRRACPDCTEAARMHSASVASRKRIVGQRLMPSNSKIGSPPVREPIADGRGKPDESNSQDDEDAENATSTAVDRENLSSGSARLSAIDSPSLPMARGMAARPVPTRRATTAPAPEALHYSIVAASPWRQVGCGDNWSTHSAGAVIGACFLADCRLAAALGASPRSHASLACTLRSGGTISANWNSRD